MNTPHVPILVYTTSQTRSCPRLVQTRARILMMIATCIGSVLQVPKSVEESVCLCECVLIVNLVIANCIKKVKSPHLFVYIYIHIFVCVCVCENWEERRV